MPAYQFHHVVSFEETSLVGNVYFANYLLWQGHCREKFLHDHAPGVAQELLSGQIALITRRCSCDYKGARGFHALEKVLIEMNLLKFRGGRMTVGFRYLNPAEDMALVATGTQEAHCYSNQNGSLVPVPFPVEVVESLMAFAETDELRACLQETIEFQEERDACSD